MSLLGPLWLWLFVVLPVVFVGLTFCGFTRWMLREFPDTPIPKVEYRQPVRRTDIPDWGQPIPAITASSAWTGPIWSSTATYLPSAREQWLLEQLRGR